MARKKVPIKSQRKHRYNVRFSDNEILKIKRYMKKNKIKMIAPLLRNSILDKIATEE